VGDERSIKILRIITRLNTGGPAQHVVLLTEGLGGGPFKCKLVFGAIDIDEGDMSYLIRDKGLAFTEIGSLRNGAGLIGNLKAFLQILMLIRKEKPDLVHLHLLKARFLGGVAAKVARVPLVVETLHGDLFTDYYGCFKTRAILLVERLLGHLVMDRVIAISEKVKDNIVRFNVAPLRKVEVIPLGLELLKFADPTAHVGELKKELGVAQGCRLVGMIGRMVPIKGCHYFLQAAHEIIKVDPRVRFVLVGDGILRANLEFECQQLGISKAVTFLGWRKDLCKIYADLDVVVLSSLNEGTPLSVIEAMAAGKGVVATEVGGVSDVVTSGETGLLVPPKDSKALAEAVLRLLRDEKLRRGLEERAKASVYPKYDISRLTQDMENLYLRLASSRVTSPMERTHPGTLPS